jgi:oligosaccharide repeat unit polymerase
MQGDDFTRFLIHITGLLAVGILFLLIRKRIKPFSFYLFFSLVWLILLIGSEIIDSSYRLLPFTLFIFYLAWASLLVGVLIYSNVTKMNNDNYGIYFVKYNYKILYFISIFLFLMNFFVVYDVFRGLIANGLSISNFSSLRSLENQEYLQQSRPLFQLFGRSYLIYIPILLFLYSKRKLKLTILAIIVGFGFIFSASYFTRAPILQLFITIFVSLLIFFHIGVKKMLPRLILFTVTIILILTVMQNAIQLRNENSSENLGSSLILYVFGGQKAFEDIINNSYPSVKTSYYSLDSVNYFFERAGLISDYPSLVREYSVGNIFTNVYTYLDAYYIDLGIIGIILGPLFIGAFITHAYRYANRRTSILWSVVYAYCVYGLLISFLNNEFIRVNIIIIFLETFLIEIISREKLFNHQKNHERFRGNT